MIRVVIADDHHLVRQGIRALLDKSSDIEVIAEAEDGQQAVELVENLAPDVLIVDIAMPRLSGIQALAKIRASPVSTQVVVLSMYSDETLIRQALGNGAKGYLLKRAVTEELLLAVRAAHQGESYLSPAISNTILTDFVNQKSTVDEMSQFDRLTSREREVLQLIAEGHTNNEIAELMTISFKTVEKHRANLMEKLQIHDVPGLTRIAIKHGLVFLDE